MLKTNLWDKTWLVGGGLASPWTYNRLISEVVAGREADEPKNLADVLVGLTRALYFGREVSLLEPTFVGEGEPDEGGPVSRTVSDTGSVTDFISKAMSSVDEGIRLTSSGSMGVPTTVRHTLRTLARAVVVAPRHADDIFGLAFNPTHIAGVQVYLQAFANGNTMVNLWGLPPAEVVARCRQWNVTHLSATPTFYRMLAAEGTRLPQLRSLSMGGEVVDEALLRRLRDIFPAARIHNIYASTEAGTLLISEGVDFTLPENLVGKIRLHENRIWVHRDLLGRFSNTDEWFDTGDRVEVTTLSPPRFRIVGRTHSAVNVGGEKVNPSDIESVLSLHPAIAAAHVYGVRNSVTGELLAADLVTQGAPPDEMEVRKHLALHLPAHRIPRILRFVDRLNVNRSGKIKRDV